LVKKGAGQGNMRDVSLEIVAEYAAEDADITFQLAEKLRPELQKIQNEKLFYEVETPLIQVLCTMERNGVSIDVETLRESSISLEKEIQILEQEIYNQAGREFNIASPRQLGEVLFDELKLIKNPKKTKTGQYATGEDILSKLADEHPIVANILEIRELQKLKSTYIDALPELISPLDKKIHTTFNQAVTATGRLSSSNPNLQNIPIKTAKGREIRKAFVPSNDEFLILSADYSQIELRLMAAFSQDETMLDAFAKGKIFTPPPPPKSIKCLWKKLPLKCVEMPKPPILPFCMVVQDSTLPDNSKFQFQRQANSWKCITKSFQLSRNIKIQ
jgi:DNA polymerase-1